MTNSIYYILTNGVANEEADAVLEGYSRYLHRIDCSFAEGISLPVEDIDVPIAFDIDEFSTRGVMTDHLSVDDIPGPVFSLAVKQLFEKLGLLNIEYYQLILTDEFPEGVLVQPREEKNRKAVVYHDYYISNVVGLVDCVDHYNSLVEYYYPRYEAGNPDSQGNMNIDAPNNPFAGENPNEIDFITKLVLDESKIDPSLKIFRLKDKPDLLVFHESVVNEIRKKKLTGFVFVPVEEYTDAIPDDDDTNEQRKEEDTVEQEPVSLPRTEPQAPPPTELKPITEPRQPLEEPAEKKKGRSRFFID
jgi:hypothetical protein